ncbi:MAG: ACT domain-containing protein [Lachnospiraceae bacterium]|nr:ACT domain-containing protein [Lachnospiraceae bacterium]
MEIERIGFDFSICKVKDFSMVNLEDEYCFIGKTEEEKSLVCITENVPDNTTEREDNWKAFKIRGILDFSLIGILSKISALLAENNIGIFVLSTYNTDYVLTKANDFEKALDILSKEFELEEK